MEEWRDIEGYEGRYMVSNKGNVFSLLRDKLMKPVKCRKGYLRVGLRDEEGARKSHGVHRLVAQAFIYNEYNKPQVNHIDENKENNSAENLEWVTNLENCNHGTKIQRTMLAVSKPVLHVKDGEYTEYINAVEASNATGTSKATIRHQCVSRVIFDINDFYIYYNEIENKTYTVYVYKNHEFSSVTQCAEHLNICRNTVTRWVKQGSIGKEVRTYETKKINFSAGK